MLTLVKSLFIVGCLAATTLAAPPITVRGSNNQITARIYQNGNSYRVYGTYNNRIGTYRNNQFYGPRGEYLGKVYGQK